MANYTLFYWQAVNVKGEIISGTKLSNSSHVVSEQLTRQGYSPLKIKRGKTWRKQHWRTQHRIMFLRQLATMLRAGLTLSQSIKFLSEGHPHIGWQTLLQEIQRQIEQGSPFSEILSQWPEIFPPLFPALMSVGEVTGQLEACSIQLARQQEEQHLLQKKVIKALRYPLIILLLAMAVTTAMLLLVLPEFVSLYATFDAPLPTYTAAVLKLSAMTQHYMLPLLISFIALLTFWRHQRRKRPAWQRKEQQFLLRIPLISTLYRGSQLSHIFTTMTLTQQAGLTLLESLQAVEKTLSDRLWRDAIIALQQHIARGNPLHQALERHPLFTPLCYQLIRVGEEAGSLDTLLARLAQWYKENTHELADSLAAMLEPLMMVVIGGIIGSLIIAMYLPVFNLGDVLR